MLECPPPLNTSHATTYIPEDARFFHDPISFLRERYPPRGKMPLPSHFVLFEDPIAPLVAPFLREHCYRTEARLFNTWASSDDRTKGDVVVHRREKGGAC